MTDAVLLAVPVILGQHVSAISVPFQAHAVQPAELVCCVKMVIVFQLAVQHAPLAKSASMERVQHPLVIVLRFVKAMKNV